MKTAVLQGGHGFIAHHLARYLRQRDYWVRTVDVREYEYGPPDFTDDYVIKDLTLEKSYKDLYLVDDKPADIVLNLAALMGGANIVLDFKYDFRIMRDSSLINIHTLENCVNQGVKKVFLSSSACIYNYLTQEDKDNPDCRESTAWPSWPDSCYGKEKIYAEEMYDACRRNCGLDVRIARFHNIFGVEGAWCDGREKAPAALCRKVAMAENNSSIEIYGDGEQTRSFLDVSEACEGIFRIINSDYHFPLNLGSTELISINDLAKMVMDIAGKKLDLVHIKGPLGVRGRVSENTLIQKTLGWSPSRPLREGMEKLYSWVDSQIHPKTNKDVKETQHV